MSLQWRWMLLLVAAIVVLATGFVLMRSGRPYGTGMLTVHKLVDLAAIVLVAVSIIGTVRAGGAATLDWVVVIVAVVFVIATLATGGIISASETPASWIMLAHRWLPWPLLGLLGVAFYQLAARG